MAERFEENVDLLLVGGPQGAGKSSLATRWFRDRRRVNRDEIRAFHRRLTTGRDWRTGDWNQSIEPLITTIEMAVIRHELAAGNQVVVDNTLINEELRAPYIALAKELGKSIGCLFLALPLELCRTRNQARDLTVPDQVLLEFHQSMTPPSLAEGLDCVRVMNHPVALH